MLEDLPEDIIILILKRLDFKSLANLYEVSSRLQNIILVYKVIKECNISFSTMATVKTLQSCFFMNIAHNLLNLNLSGVCDLCKSTLMPVMTKLKNLEMLDVSYTTINLVDFMDIYKVCPTIKKVAINFYFGKKCSTKVPKITLLECQKVFKQFECVHFVGNDCNLLYSEIAIFILSLANLKFLQYTIVEEDTLVYTNTDYENKMQVHIEHLFVCIPFVKRYGYINILAPFNILDFQCYEYIILNLNKEPCVIYATEMFNKFFQERFDLKVNSSIDININGSVCLMLWNKNLNVFDDRFFNLLYKKIKPYFICYPDDKWNATDLSKYDRFCIKPRQKENSNYINSNDQLGFKKRRIVPPNFVLNYDEEFKDKHELELSLVFTDYINTAITLPSNCEYLQKLTYLNLNGSVKYNNNFFNILFRSCVKLVTLNVEANNLSTCTVSRSVPLSHTIKNLRIVGKRIDFNTVLTSLSQCSNLENVHIGDKSLECSNIFDPTTMIQKCSNLYCVYIYKFCSSETKLAKQLKIINKAKARCNKMYINFKVLKSEIDLARVSNPYVHVFSLFTPIN